LVPIEINGAQEMGLCVVLGYFAGHICHPPCGGISKLLAAGFMKVILHPEWMAIPVLVKMNSAKWW